MNNLDKSQIDSFKESGYTFEEIKHIDNALGEDGGYTPAELYMELLKHREKVLCTK
ncbi:MAG: hypothetical protein Q8K30_00260 [Candidatus Gracilibacteria bacterium]|nr:hypothetical protein [Candidatus Gracilibacteria bacterium]